ncbi:hypothetical protein NBRC116591_17930 [Sessilibacter corallicola]|uniref:Uncharacterized protein n=1 Tax=Sessilibacter corallicola TaxID=2904075 RepID=A0ABQ0A8L3_9GAMM
MCVVLIVNGVAFGINLAFELTRLGVFPLPLIAQSVGNLAELLFVVVGEVLGLVEGVGNLNCVAAVIGFGACVNIAPFKIIKAIVSFEFTVLYEMNILYSNPK